MTHGSKMLNDLSSEQQQKTRKRQLEYKEAQQQKKKCPEILIKNRPLFHRENYRDLKKFKEIPSEYIGKKDLIYVKSEKQLFQFKRSIEEGLVYYCSAKKCSAQILLRNGECLKHCLSSKHNHPEVDSEKIKRMKIIAELKREVQSSSFNWNCKNKWNELFERFSLR